MFAQDNPELTLAEQAKKLGAMWKALSPEEQTVYKEKAQAKRDEDEASAGGAADADPLRVDGFPGGAAQCRRHHLQRAGEVPGRLLVRVPAARPSRSATRRRV